MGRSLCRATPGHRRTSLKHEGAEEDATNEEGDSQAIDGDGFATGTSMTPEAATADRTRRLSSVTSESVPVVEADPASDTRALVELAKQGDRQAFANLYRIYLPTVYKFIYYRQNGNKAMAEDMTGEVFLRALRKIEDYQVTGADFGAWLVRIARNLIYDNTKSARHRLEQLADETPEDACGVTETTEDQVVQGLENKQVVAAIEKLSPDQRDVITMRFLQGWEVSEVAEALGKKEGTVRTLQFRGLKALQKVLVKDGIVDPSISRVIPGGVREETNGRTGDVTESEAARYGVTDGAR